MEEASENTSTTPENNAAGKKSFIEIKDEAIKLIETCYDPEIPVNIYELGLIYEVTVSPDCKKVHVLMTLTSPFCPAAQSLPEEVKSKVVTIEGVEEVDVEITFEPPWEQDMMSESAKLQLGMM